MPLFPPCRIITARSSHYRILIRNTSQWKIVAQSQSQSPQGKPPLPKEYDRDQDQYQDQEICPAPAAPYPRKRSPVQIMEIHAQLEESCPSPTFPMPWQTPYGCLPTQDPLSKGVSPHSQVCSPTLQIFLNLIIFVYFSQKILCRI